ncbi:LacI family transcriptional regulator [Microbacterium mitrae]|uniref:LacI family transcriptional regulator n=2 Tax=Microbacterium mitrae TaxID=664640 RepID=A0A5C8HN57_9MICO|nr:LacI family transcriptional regulator [Microbacterium mitrae]
MKVTLVEVAERAGVSLGSASRAMNDQGASEAMVERVRTAAVELGYRPDASGRSLRMKQTKQIAFAVADIGNPVYVEMLSAIHETVSPAGYRVVVMQTGQTAHSTAELVRTMSAGIIDAMILSPLRLDDELLAALTSAPMPIVVIGRPLPEHGIDSVSTDSAVAIGMAVDHLIDIGRTHIGFINGPLDTTPGAARQRGFVSAAQQRLASEASPIEIADDFTVAAGLIAANTLLTRAQESGTPINAIVAANDLLAIGVIRAAKNLGLRVPEDLAVTGVDNTEIGGLFQPSITSVSLGSTERAHVAAQIVLERIAPDAGHGGEVRQAHIGPTLVARESTGAADPMLTSLNTTPRQSDGTPQ